jgi:GNAT superfamily N-acetyltransferase
MPIRVPVEIRPVGIADHNAWLPLWQGYQRFYMTEIPVEVSAINWQRFLDPADPLHAALAWADGRAVGLVHWLYHRSSWTIGDYCYLEDLFIARELRGQGIGRQLIEHVEAAARAADCSKLYWLTHETNTSAMRLYARVAEHSGFVQYAKTL